LTHFPELRKRLLFGGSRLEMELADTML